MAYIGREPIYGKFERQSLTADGSTTTFSLNYTIGSAASILVNVAGVVQEPGVAYTLGNGGTQIVFSAAPASTDNVYRKGFWKYSRHPNYFFQWLAWVGFFIFSLNSSGLFTIYCPLLMLFLLTKVTGINNNEAHNIASKGKEYLIYQKTTSCFIPLPPRKYKY